MYIYIKNMVCVRCKMIVGSILDRLEFPYTQIELGRVQMQVELTTEHKNILNIALNNYELELMDNSKQILVELVKVTIVGMFHSASGDRTMKLSDQLSKSLHYDYTYLSNVFSEIEKSTIEKFYILQKIERVKELIKYEGMSAKEISFHLKYSSTAHLCKQFKMVTGLSTAKFKKLWEMEGTVHGQV